MYIYLGTVEEFGDDRGSAEECIDRTVDRLARKGPVDV